MKGLVMYLSEFTFILMLVDSQVPFIDFRVGSIEISTYQCYSVLDCLLPFPCSTFAFKSLENILNFFTNVDLMQSHGCFRFLSCFPKHFWHQRMQHQDSLVLLDLFQVCVFLLYFLICFVYRFGVFFNFTTLN